MQNTSYKKTLAAALISSALSLVLAGEAHAKMDGNDPVLDKSVAAALEQCQQISTSCADTTRNSVGVLVFPSVVKADVIIGGAGGKGALIENGTITGYYSIGAASVGLQVGVENASQVYVFRTADALARLKSGPDWKADASAGVTLISADANAKGSTGNILAYVFDAKGLHAGVSIGTFDIWKTGEARPSQR